MDRRQQSRPIASGTKVSQDGKDDWRRYQSTAPAFIFVSLVLIVPLVLMLRLSVYQYDPVQMYIEASTFENYCQVLQRRVLSSRCCGGRCGFRRSRRCSV